MTDRNDRPLAALPLEKHATDEPLTDEHTAKRIEAGERKDEALAEKGLRGEDGTIELEPKQVKYDEPPGTEQMAG